MQHHLPVPGDPTGRNHVLDSFRGFASLAVVFSHVYSQLHTAGFASAHSLDESFGSMLQYLFQGSSVYFMIISGFMLAGNLAHWNNTRNGIVIKALQRITKILVVYWAALFILISINLIRKVLVGTVWVPATFGEVLSQFLFLSNFQTSPLYIPPAWYLQADLIIFILVVTIYVMWNRLPIHWRIRLRPKLFLGAIPVLALSLFIETSGQTSDLALSVVRLILYFSLGFLAFYAQNYKSALFSFITLVVAMLICNDRYDLHQRFYTNMSIIIAFIFVMSGYSKNASSFFNQPWMKKLYKLNFAIFLLHWFILIIGLSIARHFTPNSTIGLVFVLIFTFIMLFVVASLFEHYVQQPILRWHDKVWASWLSAASQNVSEPVVSDQAVPKQLKVNKALLTNS